MIVFLLIVCVSGAELGENLIVNSRFEYPNILPLGTNCQFLPKSILGWTCTNYCQVDNCQLAILLYLGFNKLFGNCKGQVLDLSSNNFEEVTQSFQASQGEYLLSVDFYLPTFETRAKTLLILLNGKVIETYQPQTDMIADVFHISKSVYLLAGVNNLTFTMGGLNTSSGFRLSQVSVRRIINLEIENFIDNFFNNYFLLNVISFPGSRTLIGPMSHTLISFDRMQLYYYHNRSYSYYATIFFRTVSNLLDAKNQLCLTVGHSIFPASASEWENSVAALDYKYAYINANMLGRSENGYGFVSNNVTLVLYSLPFYTALLALLFLVFRVSFDFKVSKVVRKYSFSGVVFLLMVCEGNVEQYSFYCFGEFTTLFSAELRHKAVNCAVLAFFFVVLLASTAFSFLVWGTYRKKAVYFIDGFRLSLGGVAAFALSDGFIAMLFGAVHQLLLSRPNLQLLALGLLQAAWIAAQLLFLSSQLSKGNFFIGLSVLEGFLRISMQISLYSYANLSEDDSSVGKYLNDTVHLGQIFLFIALRALCFMVYVFISLKNSLVIIQCEIKLNQKTIMIKKVRIFRLIKLKMVKKKYQFSFFKQDKK